MTSYSSSAASSLSSSSYRIVTAREVSAEACHFVPTPTADRPNHITYDFPAFRNALLDVAADRGYVDPRKRGAWLGNNKGKVIPIAAANPHPQDCRIVAAPELDGNRRWRLQQRQSDRTWL